MTEGNALEAGAEPQGEPRPVADWRLIDIHLEYCNATRGDGSVRGLRTATQDENEIEAFFDGDLTYAVSQRAQFKDKDEELVGQVEASFRLSYAVGEVDPPDDLVQQFSRSAILQSVPFFRELFASMTMRMGLPTYQAPLVKGSQIRLREDTQD